VIALRAEEEVVVGEKVCCFIYIYIANNFGAVNVYGQVNGNLTTQVG